jgi:hypothetical protein
MKKRPVRQMALPRRNRGTSISSRCRAFDEVRNFLRPASYINQTVSLMTHRAIHVQRVAALRDLISAA